MNTEPDFNEQDAPGFTTEEASPVDALVRPDLRSRFTANAEQFDALMIEMLEENDRLEKAWKSSFDQAMKNGAEAKRLDCLLKQTASEAYQVISELADCQQLFDHPAVSGALNYFEDIASGEKGKRFKGEILPFSM